MKNRIRTSVIVFGFSCAAFLVLAFLMYFSPSVVGSSRIWKGYFMVLTESTVPLSVVSEALDDAGYRGVISLDRAVLDISIFDETETISPERLERRFGADDPRYDEYLRTIRRLFIAEDSGRHFNVAFVPSSELSFIFANRIREAFHGRVREDAYVIPEYAPLRQILSLAFYAAIVAVSLMKAGRLWPFLLPGIVSWVFLLVSEGDYTFAGACFLFLFQGKSILSIRECLVEAMNSPGPHTGKMPAVVDGLMFGAVCILVTVMELTAVRGGTHSITIVSGLLLSLVSGVIVLSGEAVVQEHRIHRLFIPVPISATGRNGSDRRIFRIVIPILVIIVGPFPGELTGGRNTAVLPVFFPVISGYGFSWESLEKLRSERSPASLPDVTDYLSHRAFLDGLRFGRTYGMPEKGETVRVPGYVRDDAGRVSEKAEIMVSFDDGWVSSTISGTAPGSPERLFVTQGVPGSVVPGTIESVRFSGRYVILHLLFVCLCAVLLTIASKKVKTPTLYGMGNILTRRDLSRKDHQAV